MKRLTFCSLGAVLVAIAGTTVPGPVPTMTPAFTVGRKTVVAEPALLSGEAFDGTSGVALLMGGSGVPIPPENLVQEAFDNYAVPHGFGGYTPQVLFTPEGLSPIYGGIKSLPLDTSVAQGVTILNDAIKNQLEAGNNVLVGGVSQSATISSLEMRNIVNGSLGFQPSPDQLAFILLGDPSNPNGGILERFDIPAGSSPSIPSLGITFSGATPADTGFPTYIYTLEYDGWADFPRYPINFLSDLNAFAGILYVHGLYTGGVSPDQIANAIELPTSPGYDGGTTYYMIPHENLPLLQPLQGIPVVGKPLADLLQPILTPLVNLGYGDPDFGWSQAPANVATPIGVFPSPNMVLKALEETVAGIPTGFEAATKDLGSLQLPSLSELLPTAQAISDVTAAASQQALLSSPTDIVNALTAMIASDYAVLLPTADIATALLTTLPLNDANIFVNELGNGDLLDAVGLPIAADVGLVTLAGGVEFMVLDSALRSTISTLTSLF